MRMFTTVLGPKAKFALGAVAMAASLVTLTPAPAEAQGWGRAYGRPAYAPRVAHRRHGYRARRNNGAAIAAGIIGGIAVGAMIAGASRRARAAESYHYGYSHQPPAYGYGHAVPVQSYGHVSPAYPYGRGYGGRAYAAQPPYQQGCYYRMVRQHVGGNQYVIRQVQICE